MSDTKSSPEGAAEIESDMHNKKAREVITFQVMSYVKERLNIKKDINNWVS